MKRNRTLILALSLCLLIAAGCRSRRKVTPAPQPVPPVAAATEPQPTIAVAPPDREFQPPPENTDVLSEDIAEADRVAHERGWIRDAFFHYDAATLDGDAQEALRQSATWLRDHPEFRIRIEGHCDERGTEQYNLALGDRRASSAVSFLVAAGVERARIETVSFGEERPFQEGSTEEAWAQNRRAHLALSGRR